MIVSFSFNSGSDNLQLYLGLCGSTAQWPLANYLSLNLGNQEMFAPNLHVGCVDLNTFQSPPLFFLSPLATPPVPT